MSDRTIDLILDSAQKNRKTPVPLRHAVIAGWTGRGIAPPSTSISKNSRRPASVPVFYRISAARVTTADRIEALGGVRPSSQFAFELEDPVLGWKIQHEYRVNFLPLA